MRRLARALLRVLWYRGLLPLFDRAVLACFPVLLSAGMGGPKRVRFYAIDGTRIGHFAETASTILRIQQKDPDVRNRHVAIMGPTGFDELAAVIGTQLHLIRSPLINGAIYRAGFIAGCLARQVNNPHLRELEGIYKGTSSVIQLSAEQRARGAAMMEERYGLSPDDWFIAFHSRDAAYLQKARPGRDWGYHSYRDSTIAAVKPAVKEIIDQGGWAIRVGESTNEPIRSEWGPRVIDYAGGGHDPFLDLYIFERCRFAIVGGGSGIGFLAQLFDRPVLWTNFIPVYPWPWNERDVFIPKLIRRRADGKVLSFQEMAQFGLMSEFAGTDDQFYLDHDLEPVENDGEDIRNAVRGLQATLDGNKEPPPDRDAQAAVRRAYGAEYLGGARVCPAFLKQHPALLGETQPQSRTI